MLTCIAIHTGFPPAGRQKGVQFTAIYGKGRDKFQFFFVSFSVFFCDRLRMYVSTYIRNRERQKLRIRMPRQVGGSAVSLFSPCFFLLAFHLPSISRVSLPFLPVLLVLCISLPFSLLLYLFFSRSTRECAPLDLFKCANLSGDLRCWPCRRIFSLFSPVLFFSLLFVPFSCRFLYRDPANFALWPSSEWKDALDECEINSTLLKENCLFHDISISVLIASNGICACTCVLPVCVNIRSREYDRECNFDSAKRFFTRKIPHWLLSQRLYSLLRKLLSITLSIHCSPVVTYVVEAKRRRWAHGTHHVSDGAHTARGLRKSRIRARLEGGGGGDDIRWED